MANTLTAAQKAAAGERLTLEDALELYHSDDLLNLAMWARAAKERKSGKKVYYNVNRHINLTNICVSGCPLCAFACKPEEKRAYVMTEEEVVEIVKSTAARTPG